MIKISRNIQHVPGFLISLFIFAGVISTSMAQSRSSQLMDEPEASLPQITGTIGETLSIPLTALNLIEVEGIDAIIQFDPAIIQCSGVTLSGGIFPASDYTLISNTSQPGKAIITLYAHGSLASGSGDIVFISFNCIANGNSPLLFQKFEVNETSYLSNCTNGSISISHLINQTLSFQQGWTAISSYLAPQNNSMSEIFASISNNLIVVMNLSGETYQPTGVNSLENWDFTSGYFVKTNAATSLDIEGFQPANTTINLSAGWNLIPVLSDENVLIAELFAGQLEKLQIIKEAIGSKVFWPEMAISKLEFLQPGNSYLVKMHEPTIINF